MTKAEILKQIEELKQKIEVLPNDEKKIRTLPIEDEKYTYIAGGDLRFYTSCYPDLFDDYQTKENSSIGNYFKSEDDAAMVFKAMKIEQAIRIRRIELNDGWEPEFEIVSEANALISFNENRVYSDVTWTYNFYPIFGYYKSKEVAEQIIDEFKDDLEWYFTEYYPNRDKMYVWGQSND